VVTYSCPAGATVSGSNCISTVTQPANIASYTCAAGTLSGSSCVATSTSAASVGYSCPAGSTVSGSNCISSTTTTTAGTPVYSCSAGYTLAGTTCSVQGTATAAATLVLSCPSGGTLSGTTCEGAVSRTRYEAYGNTAAGSVPRDIGFTGHVNDPDTGLVYMQQRYYDPMAARFMSLDPVVTDANTGTAFNRFNYANNNPYKFADPDGRQSKSALEQIHDAEGWTTVYQAGTSTGGMSQSSRATTVAAGAALGGSAGAVVAAGCAGVTVGVCGVGAPAIVGAGIAGGALLGNSAANLFDWMSGLFTSASSNSGQATSPVINPSDVAGKTPGQIDQLATGAGLKPKGPDPQNGRGAYVDPVTGEQRILVHGDHAHVNNAAGNRLDVNGNVVPSNSPAAHLPIGTP
jgi:RHS repeat-associated protein